MYWDHALSANTLGVGTDYQSRDPVYEMTIGLRPRYYFIDNDRLSLSVRGDFGIVAGNGDVHVGQSVSDAAAGPAARKITVSSAVKHPKTTLARSIGPI